jgi:predicted phosphodiesterase
MLIAIFGDLHGKILLAFKLCQRWQKEHKENLDFILQAGDLGVWPDIVKLDKATARHIEADENELGFIDFANGSETLDSTFLNKDFVLPDLYFITGNHEDFDFLNSCADKRHASVPIDAYHKINYIANGKVFTYTKEKEKIIVGALGGVDRSTIERPERKHPDAYFTDKEIQELSLHREINILLTHHGSITKKEIFSEKIQALRNSTRPQYHFYGHLHKEESIQKEGNTFLVQLNLLGFRRNSGILTKQAFGVLDWHDKKNHKFEFVSDEWVKEYTKYTWDKV